MAKALEEAAKAPAEQPAVAAAEQPAASESEQPTVGDLANPEDTPQTTATENGQEGEGEVAQSDGEDFDLSPVGPLPPSELQAKLKSNPALAAELERDPELRNSLFAASRLSQKAVKYDEVFPGGIEEAHAAAEGNATFSNLASLFGAVKDRKSTQDVLLEMMKLSYVLGDDGQPVVANGQPRTDGTVGRFIHQSFGLGLDHWAQVARDKGDDELSAAVDVLQARAFNPRTASAQEDLTEEQRTRQQELEQRTKTLDEQQQAIDTEKRQGFEQKADSAYYGHMDKMVDRVLAKASLDDDASTRVRQEIKDQVDELLTSNPQFVGAQNAIWNRSGYGEKKLADLTALGSHWISEVLPGIARAALAKAGKATIAAQQDKTARMDARANSSRSEPAASMRHTVPQTLTTQQLHQKARETFQAKTGRLPSEMELLRTVRELRTSGVKTA
jgi:hypothetical protein